MKNFNNYKKLMMRLVLAAILIVSFNSAANAYETAVATIQKVIGAARVKMSSSGKVRDLAENQTVDEGDLIQTTEHSIVKLKFIDETEVVISSNSKFYINSYPKNEAGVFALLRGEMRSIVSKKYPANVDKSKSKLYIRTKTAVMGIRGTDFQVNYNPDDRNTSLITFHGKVAMNALDDSDEKFTRKGMEDLLNRNDAVFVETGHASVVDRSFSRKIMKPVRINEEQFKALKINNSRLLDRFKEEHKEENKDDPKNDLNGAVKLVLNDRGFLDKTTGDYKAPEGSLMDLEKSTIVPAFQTDARKEVNSDSGRINMQREKVEAAKEKFRETDMKPIKEERGEMKERVERRQDKIEKPEKQEKPEKPERRERPEREPLPERREQRLPTTITRPQ